MLTSHEEKAVAKLKGLVDYLLELARLTTHRIRTIDDYQHVLWLGKIPNNSHCRLRIFQDTEGIQNTAPDHCLTVERPKRPPMPTPPTICRDWIDASTLPPEDGNIEHLAPPQLVPRRKPLPPTEADSAAEGLPADDPLSDHPDVIRAWEAYIQEEWLPWKERFEEWRQSFQIYSTLFTIRQEQIRRGEQCELVVGIGLLSWRSSGGQPISRHLLVVDASLNFDPSSGTFTLQVPSPSGKLRLETDMLDAETNILDEKAIQQQLEQAGSSVWDRSITEPILKTVAHQLDPLGQYDPTLTPNSSSRLPPLHPKVEWAPALILRRRSSRGLLETLKNIKNHINSGEGRHIPAVFLRLAEIETEEACSDVWASPQDASAPNPLLRDEVYFPKPTNEEQRQILQKLAQSDTVLVQGPPGTGKSHTIANLICHLLAMGQRILVTAQSSRPLRVLRNLLPEELRPLCIQLLGEGSDELHSLESSVKGILGRKDRWSEPQYEKSVQDLRSRLANLRKEHAEMFHRLCLLRESETRHHSVAGGAYEGTAAQIAKRVDIQRAEYGWFEDEPPETAPCPISGEQLAILLSELRHFTPDHRKMLALLLPDAWPSDRFRESVAEESRWIQEERSLANRGDPWLIQQLAYSPPGNLQRFIEVFSILRKTHPPSDPKMPWLESAAHELLNNRRDTWEYLFQAATECLSIQEKDILLADNNRLEIPEGIDTEGLLTDIRLLKEHLRKHPTSSVAGFLSWHLRPGIIKRRHLLKRLKLNGHPCRRREDLETVERILSIRKTYTTLWKCWPLTPWEELIQRPFGFQRATLQSYRDLLDQVFRWSLAVKNCREILATLPTIPEPDWLDRSALDKMFDAVRTVDAARRKEDCRRRIENYENELRQIASSQDAHPLAAELLTAVRNRDIPRYEDTLNRIEELNAEKRRLADLESHLDKWRQHLPRLIQAMEETCLDEAWDRRVSEIQAAWRWAQARSWVTKLAGLDQLDSIKSRIKQIEAEIQRTIAQLAALHAWHGCLSNLTEPHRKHMEAWQQAMKRLGKGTGKYAARHRREAQTSLLRCRDAVPAWIMPLYRVWDTVPCQPGIFDIVIVDEASQCGLDALPLFFLAKKTVIVGDDKQISPEAVGIDQSQMYLLQERHLKDFEIAGMFHIKQSLFDITKYIHQGHQITLREHFRCMPEIIRFSNRLFYSDTPLIPLRQYGANRLPPLEHVFVPNGYRLESVPRNPPEAEAIVDRIVQMCRDPRYDGKTIGVISLLGDEQAKLIETQLLQKLGPTEMEKRSLLCGNPYSFQGDERDIILLSMVVARNQRTSAMSDEDFRRRFNVAASRARDQMILFHSMGKNDFSPDDMRWKLIEFFEEHERQGKDQASDSHLTWEKLEHHASHDDRRILDPPHPFESWFEVDVALEILRKGFDITPQYEVGGKRIDIVVEGGMTRLAVECDGDHWHGPEEYARDIHRQRQLERCGWEFFRVRESVFYADRAAALTRLWSLLQERDIRPAQSRITASCFA